MKHHYELNRFISVLLVLCVAAMFVPMLVLPAQAALTDTNIGTSISGSTDQKSIEGTTVSASVRCGYLGLSDSKSHTITLTNNSGQEAILSFVYSTEGGNGNTQIHEVKYYSTSSASAVTVSLSSGSTFKQTLQAGGRVEIYAKAGRGDTVATTLKDITLKIKTTANVSFVPDSIVSYTVGYVDGDGASKTASVAAGGTENVTVEAELSEGISITPADGYICESATGSTSGTVFIDKDGKCTFAKNETVTPVFLSNDAVKPFTHLGNSKSYATLGAAVNAGSGIVVLNQNYTLPAGNYTIPYGVQLLLPYNEANIFRGKPNDWTLDDMSLTREGFPDPPEVNIVSAKVWSSTPNVEYRRMTMAEGAHITVNGSLEVSGQTHPLASGQWGNYAVLQMGNNTSITVGSTGTLYAYGFIRGNGTVTVESKGVVYEHYDVADYPPGGAGGLDPMNTAGVFGMTNYTFNNVEVPTTYKAGAKLRAYLVMTGYNIGTNAFTRDFIGSDTDAVFNLKSGTITKTYSGGRQNFVIAGGVEFNKLYIKINAIVKEYTVDSSKTSGLPISHNWDIVIKDGTTATLNGSVLMYAGSTLTIEDGGKLVIPSGIKFSLLDPESDPSSVTANSVLDLNGEVQVNGGFYNSYTGTSIPVIKSSEGTGKITVNAVGTETTFNVRASGDNYAAVNVTPAKLQNSDSTIVDTAKGGVNTYTYTDGKWICTTHTEEETIQTPAACETAGVKTVTCKVCGTTRTEEIPALTHKDENPKDHICDNGCEVYQGTHADGDDNNHTCDYCNGTVEGDVCVDANSDHKCDECAEITSSCVDANPKDHVCDYTGCQATMGDHKNGTNTHTCEYCGQAASTCSDIDTDSDHNCDVCGAAVGGHSYGEPVFSWNGYECTAKVVCSCGAEQGVEVNVTSAVTTEATCKVNGVKTYTATAEWNGETYTAAEYPTEDLGLNSNNHKNTKEKAQVDATCTSVGYTAGVYCGDCKTWISGHEEIEANGHNYQTLAGYAASCTQDGLTDGVQCTVCKNWQTSQETIPAIGHKNETADHICDNGCGTIVSECGEKEVEYGGGKVKINRDMVGNLKASTFVQKMTVKAMLDKVDFCADSVSGLDTLLNNPDFVQYLCEILHVENEKDLLEKLAQIAMDNSVEESVIKSNAVVLYVAHLANQKNEDDIRDFLISGNVESTTSGNMQNAETYGTGLMQRALAYGMYNAYAYDSGDEALIERAEKIGETLDHVDDQEVRDFINDEQGRRDLKGMLSALKIEESAREDQNVVKTLLVQGFNDADLATKISSELSIYSHTCGVCGKVSEHVAIVLEAVAPTCTATGLTEGSKCVLCDEVLVDQEEIAIVDHTDTSPADHICDACKVELGDCMDTNPKDNVCDICGEIIETVISYDVVNNTNGTATYSINGTTLNVQNKQACAILVAHADGTYTVLEAVENSAGGYDFNLSTVVTGESILIVVKGDFTGDGRLRVDDITTLRAAAGRTAPLDAIGKAMQDLTGDGRLRVDDVTALRAAVGRTDPLSW